MQLKNPEIINIDKKVYEFNRHYGLAFYSINSVPNLFAIKNLLNELNELKSSLEKIKTGDEFEKIFIKNHLLNLENQRAYMQYSSTRDGETVDGIAKLFFGEKSIEEIKDLLINFDYESDWNFYLYYQNYAYRSYPSDSPELQERFKNLLAELKKDLVEHARKHYGLEEKYDFDLVLGQPYSNRTFFSPSTRRVEISPNNFFAYKDEKEIKIDVSAVITSLFHEFIGHALQEFNSHNLPVSIRDDSINTCVPTMSLHAEGFAQMADELSIKFMKQYSKKYNLNDDFIKQRELQFIRRKISLFSDFYNYLKLKNLESPFDYKKEYLEVAKNFGAFINLEHSENSPFGFFKNICYVFGLNRVKDIHKKLIEEFGLENEAIINKSLSTGLINIEVLHEFSRYIIKQELKNDK